MAVAAVLLAASTSLATTLMQISLPESIAAAEHVFEGKVIAAQGYKDANGMICTRVSVQVSQYLKGSGGAVYEFSIPGGSFGGGGVLIPGLPEFRVGEETIVMLSMLSRSGTRVPIGFGQGKYRISRDAKTGAKRVQREMLGEASLLQASTGQIVHEASPPERDYQDFVTEIRRIADAQSKEQKR